MTMKNLAESLKNMIENRIQQHDIFLSLIREHKTDDTMTREEIDDLIEDIQEQEEEEGSKNLSVDEISQIFSDSVELLEVLKDKKEEIQTFVEEEEKSRKEEEVLSIKYSTFAKLATIGEIVCLEGSITYSDRSGTVESRKSGRTYDLRLNDFGKVRPPMNLLLDEDDLEITNIIIDTPTGSSLFISDVKAFLKAFM